jgi:DNA-binding MarR family transcriptional regulator
MKKRALTDKQLQELQWLYLIGVEIKEIARHFNITYSAVTYHTRPLKKERLSLGQVVNQYMREAA